jgi:KDO2-lipid IV(A) lauroyltransferase
MLSKLLYYLVIKPLSLLPLPVMYILSDIIFVILYHLIGYRKKVVLNNLNNSFPNKTEKEINQISKQFYSHFFDIIVESIHLFSISKEEALKRCKCRNPELLNHYFDKGKSIALGCGHFNNWEFASVVFDAQVKHKTIGIYTSLSNAFLDEKLRKSRTKYGVVLASKKEIKGIVEENKDQRSVIVFGTDQNPSSQSKKLYWTQFLNQDTAVNYGLEKYALDYDIPVIFMKIDKIKRGYYEYDFELVTENPKDTAYGEITDGHTLALEKQIKENPQFWLWTHKRWKRKKEHN